MLARSQYFFSALLILLLSVAPALAGNSDPKLRLAVSGGNHPVDAGDIVLVTLRMADLGKHEAAGFQAFLEFDEQRLTLISSVYTPTPFGLPVISPIVEIDGQIDVAAGVNPTTGQQPTNADSSLVVFTFVVKEPMSCVSGFLFRDHDPPTRLTDGQGQSIEPLTLEGLPFDSPDPDLNDDGVVDVFDLLLLLSEWGPCDDPSFCPADLNCNGMVDVFDVLILLANWS